MPPLSLVTTASRRLQQACRAFAGGPKECTDPVERPGGKAMEKGDVAWAGGSAGPDFFIMMGRSPGFGGTHTVWGSLADEASDANLSDTGADVPSS